MTAELDLDLFGHPRAPIRDRRGRPSFKKTPENQDFVAVRAAANWSQERIAEDMGIDTKTLRKNFSRELEAGRLMIEGLLLDVLLKRARDGHTPSVTKLLDVISPTAPATRKQQQLEAEPKPQDPPGKKAKRLQDAQDMPPEYKDLYDRLGEKAN